MHYFLIPLLVLTGAVNAVTVSAAIATSVLLDHFGWLGVEQHSANLPRLIGGALMIGGIALIARY